MLAMSGFWLWWFLALLLWVAIAFWPARVPSRKGHSFLLFFIFSLFLFPAAIIVAYMVQDRRVTIYPERRRPGGGNPDDTFELTLASYETLDAARRDFDELVTLVTH